MDKVFGKMIHYMRRILDGQPNVKMDIDELPRNLHEFVSELEHFGESFMMIVNQLAQRQQELEDDATQIRMKNESLEQFSLLLSTLMQYVPQQILVLEKETQAILLMNETAIGEMYKDSNYVEKIAQQMSKHYISGFGTAVSINFPGEGGDKHLEVLAYTLEWEGRNAVIYAIADVSDTTKEIKKLEVFAYHDSLTNLYNRTYGMRILEQWIAEKRKFVLLFADLDKLKYINDVFGHNEGDIYIINAAKHLLTFPKEAVVCRLGGDEFMVLIPDADDSFVQKRAAEIYDNLATDKYLDDKKFSYSMSYGFVSVDEKNTQPPRVILSLADERMYENKKARKQQREN